MTRFAPVVLSLALLGTAAPTIAQPKASQAAITHVRVVEGPN